MFAVVSRILDEARVNVAFHVQDLIHDIVLVYRAAKAIQRAYRSYKGLKYHPPPSTPAVNLPPSAEQLDYDTYMQNLRPGSQPGSVVSVTARTKSELVSEFITIRVEFLRFTNKVTGAWTINFNHVYS